MIITCTAAILRRKNYASRDPITATVDYSTWYWMGEQIDCQFSVTNSDPVNNYYVLRRFTPLEGLKYDCLSITRKGKALAYDGIMISRSLPEASDVLIKIYALWIHKLIYINFVPRPHPQKEKGSGPHQARSGACLTCPQKLYSKANAYGYYCITVTVI